MASFDEVIPPGQVGRVTAKVDTKDLRGPVDRGITLFTDDPDQPNVPLWIHVESAGSVLLLPRPHLDLRVGQVKAPPAVRLLVRQDPGEQGELKLTGAKVDAAWLRVGTRKVVAAEPATAEFPEARPGDVVLTVEATGEVPEGSHKQTLRFDTGLSIEPFVEVPVLVYVRPRLQVSPEQVFFGPAEPDGTRRATVLVALREDVSKEPLTVEGPEGLQSTLDSAGAHRFNVRLSWSGKGTPTGTVVIRAGTVSRSVPIAPGP